MSAAWDLFSAGVFEQDAELVSQALGSAAPPRLVCATAAGVREFGHVVDNTDGIFGIAQWFPGSTRDAVGRRHCLKRADRIRPVLEVCWTQYNGPQYNRYY
jgi:hypothetical protein